MALVIGFLRGFQDFAQRQTRLRAQLRTVQEQAQSQELKLEQERAQLQGPKLEQEQAQLQKLKLEQGRVRRQEKDLVEEFHRLIHGSTQYIMISCLPKIKGRADHWSFRGYLFNLIDLCIGNEERFKRWYHLYQQSSTTGKRGKPCNDSKLTESLKTWIAFLQEDNGLLGEEQTLKMRGSSLLVSVEKDGASARDIYNENTCFEFHLLVVYILSKYWGAIAELSTLLKRNQKRKPASKASETPEAQPDSAIKNAAQRLLIWIIFLRRLSSSHILGCHLEMLAHNGQLSLPVSTLQEAYTTFFATNLTNEGWCKSLREVVSGKAPKESEELKESESDEPEWEWQEEDTTNSGPDTVQKTVRCWFKLQTVHFSSLDLLTTWATSPSQGSFTLDLDVLNFDSHPPRPMEPWKASVQRIFNEMDSDNPQRAAMVLTQIEEYLKQDSLNGKLADRSGAQKLREHIVKETPLQSCSSIHCEAALASHLHTILGADANVQIAVSKLCCPVCWDYLKIFHANRFYVHGRHLHLYPVELPTNTNLAALKVMLETYDKHLFNGLIAWQQGIGRPRAASAMSISSATSSLSGSGDEIDRWRIASQNLWPELAAPTSAS